MAGTLGLINEAVPDRTVENVTRDDRNANLISLRKPLCEGFGALFITKTADDRNRASLGKAFGKGGPEAARPSREYDSFGFYTVTPSVIEGIYENIASARR
jgi:hypothetical protein